jgi:hypothetical protein
MHAFTDTAGRSWELSLTIGAAKRVKGLLGVDLLRLSEGDPPLVSRLHTDTVLLIDTIFALLKPQADAASISDEQFGEALGGNAAWDAYQAFSAELEDFFRQFHRPDLERTVAINRKLVETKPQQAVAYVERAAAAAERVTTAEIEETLREWEAARTPTPGSASTNLPASSA